MVGTDLKNRINLILGENIDRQIVSDYMTWRKSEEIQNKKFRHYLRVILNKTKKEIDKMPCMEILQEIGFI